MSSLFFGNFGRLTTACSYAWLYGHQFMIWRSVAFQGVRLPSITREDAGEMKWPGATRALNCALGDANRSCLRRET